MTREEALKELGDLLIQIRGLWEKTLPPRIILSDIDNDMLCNPLIWSCFDNEFRELIEEKYEYLLSSDELKWLLNWENQRAILRRQNV